MRVNKMIFNDLAKVIEFDFSKIHIHFTNRNIDILVSSLGSINSDAEISSIYVGTDNELHIVVKGNI